MSVGGTEDGREMVRASRPHRSQLVPELQENGVALTFSGVINLPTDVSAHAR